MKVLTEAKQQTQYVYVKLSFLQRLLRRKPRIIGYNQRFIEVNKATVGEYALQEATVISERIQWTCKAFPLWNPLAKATVMTRLHYGRWV